MKLYKYLSVLFIFSMVLATSSCDDELEQVAFTFSGTLGAELLEGQSATVNVLASRPLASNSTVVLGYNSDVAQYGVNFTTSPQAFVDGEIRLNFPGDTEFTVTAIDDGKLTTGGYELEFYVKEFTGDFKSAANSSVKFLVQDPPTADLNLETCSGSIPSPFISANVAGSNSNSWACTSFGQTGNAVEANAFSGNSDPADSWLILDVNAVDGSAGKLNSANLSTFLIDVAIYSRFGGLGTLKMFTSTDYAGSGDPSSATWTEISDFEANIPADGSRVWEVVSVDASSAVGQAKGYVGIQFSGGVGGNSSNWRVDDMVIFAGQ